MGLCRRVHAFHCGGPQVAGNGSRDHAALWAFEVASVLSIAERKGRMDRAAQTAFLERLRLLPIAIEHRPAAWLAQQILPLARRHHISAYDAAYLELALREGLALATLDDNLRRAASDAGVALVGEA